jgi:molybdate transport system ATP-binding protein
MIDIQLQKTLASSSGQMDLDINLKLADNSFTTIYGKSGAGKTSLLRMLGGLLTPDNGHISIEGNVWFDAASKINLPTQKRAAGMVFQDYALFPNMTVRQNLQFALLKKQDTSVIDELIEIIELGDLQNRKPNTLSGGQQQRVALARALVQKPQLLMLDEPLSALDNDMRHKLQKYILEIHRSFDMCTLLVSHDVSEILRLSDQLVVLDDGKILNQGPPTEVLTNRDVSGKFQFTGEVIGLVKQDFLFIISILVGKELVKVVSEESEGKHLQIGDKVLVASKAFNPIIRKL